MHGVAPSQAGSAVVQSYLRGLSAAGLSARTAARRLSALRQFFRFLAREGVRADDPTELTESPRLPASLPKALSEAEVEALIAGAAKLPGKRGPLAVALVELLYVSGLRVSELVSLSAGALRADAPLVAVLGKGSKERLVPVSARARAGCAGRARHAEEAVALAVPLARGGRAPHAPGGGRGAEGRRDGRRVSTRSGSARTSCAIPSRRTCSGAGRTCAACNCCWAMPTSRRRRSIRRCWRSGCASWWSSITRSRADTPGITLCPAASTTGRGRECGPPQCGEPGRGRPGLRARKKIRISRSASRPGAGRCRCGRSRDRARCPSG